MVWYEIGVSQGLCYALGAIGLYIAFVHHGFPDLTFDGSFALGGSVTATMIFRGVDPVLSMLMGGLAGAAAGSLTSVLYLRFKLNKLLCGILVSTAMYTICLRVMGKSSVSLLNVQTLFDKSAGIMSNTAAWMVPLYTNFAVLLILAPLTRRMLGIGIRAFGDNESRVRSLGLPYKRINWITLMTSNALVGISGGLVTQRQGFAASDMGIGAIMWGLASILIGLPFARRFGKLELLGPVLGALLYSCAVSLGLWLGVPATDLRLATAILVVIILAVSGVPLRSLGDAPDRRIELG